MDSGRLPQTPAELAHDRYLNHLMACLGCYAPNKRHCSVGQELRIEYDAQFLMTITDTYRRKAIMRREFEQDPVMGGMLKNRVIDLWNEENQ
ncbi:MULTISPECIES: hypothetical protein [Pseudomonas]|uniref:hypothetical protein n=1 Tax=Pseudomonas TaxID=286 RepID=UPI0007618323|nr:MULTISPECIES: hypothetical protein [Pseudomonas]MDG9809465.1 hypothetical protein [Pseudomonas juntendi]MDG9815822.1 hypothetical protein [Pseudomonas putida]